jgi:hypothetical protein
MQEIEKMLKNLLILVWCGWIVVSLPFLLFSVETVVEGFLALVVGLYAFAIPASYIDI